MFPCRRLSIFSFHALSFILRLIHVFSKKTSFSIASKFHLYVHTLPCILFGELFCYLSCTHFVELKPIIITVADLRPICHFINCYSSLWQNQLTLMVVALSSLVDVRERPVSSSLITLYTLLHDKALAP